MKQIGPRIKRKRESLQMQLNDLAKRVGISSSALSQIENSKASPSITTLKEIADNLRTTVGELIGENEEITKNPLVKFDQKEFVQENSSGTKLYKLSNFGNAKHMDTFLLIFEENSDAQDLMPLHPGQEFCFILHGELEMKLDGKKYVLKKNDSFYYNSNRNHVLKNRLPGVSEVLWVITPPLG